MAHGKWIDGLQASTPVDDAARRVLTVRLESVRDYLPLAVDEADRDPENVHQLRVGTRRGGAALVIFASCLSPKALRRAKRELRGIRRAAGAARDWDVFLIALTEWAASKPSKHRPGLDFLLGYGTSQRRIAQERLEELAEEQPFAFDRFLAETVAAVRMPEDSTVRTLADLARPTLSALSQELDDAAADNLHDYDHLHQVRIIGKRLRYAMEVFADCFSSSFKEQLYPAVENMQEILGEANDSHVAIERLSSLRAQVSAARPADWSRYRLGIESLMRFHERRLPEGRTKFLQWWKKWQANDRMELTDKK
jgi:CHAD domain-containing protein